MWDVSTKFFDRLNLVFPHLVPRKIEVYIRNHCQHTEYNTFQVKHEINPFACADTWCNVVIVVDDVVKNKNHRSSSSTEGQSQFVLRTYIKRTHIHNEAKVRFVYYHTKGTSLWIYLFFVSVFPSFQIQNRIKIEKKTAEN